MTLNRWVPRLVVALAIVHFVYAFTVDTVNAWPDIARSGVLAGVDEGGPDYFRRVFALYFLAMGVFLLALGTLAAHLVKVTGRIPGQIGWYLIASGGLLSVVEFPVTGGWLVLALGILAVVASRQPGV